MNSAIAQQSAGIVDLSFAGTKWRLHGHCEPLTICADPRIAEFLSTDDRAPDASVDVRWESHFNVPGKVLFESGLWRAYEHDGFLFDFHSEILGPHPYKRAVFDRDLTQGEVLLNHSVLRNQESYYPFEYPLDELAMMHRLALGHGVEFHSCGLMTSDGSGYLFVGHSGAGKSTLGKLWVSQCRARILSDDRIIVTNDGGTFRIHGTPWHGEAGLASNASAELKAIYLIQHGQRNELIPVTPTIASAELFSRSFVPWYRPEALAFSLGFVQSIATEIPVFILRSVPNPEVIDFLEANFAV